MSALLLYLFIAMAVSFLCSLLEAVLMSTPISYISMKGAKMMKIKAGLSYWFI